MKILLKLAYRNVLRNKRRSLITFSAITISIFMLVLSSGIMTGIGNQSKRNIIDTQAGHLKIFSPQYWENRETLPLEYTLKDAYLILKLISENPEIQGSAERIVFPAMLNDGVNNLFCIGIGIDPERDKNVFKIAESINGEYLSPGDEKMLIGIGLAKILGVTAGDQLTLIARTRYNAIEARDLIIKGIINTGNPEIDNVAVFIPIKLAQQSLEMNGDITEITLRLKDLGKINRMKIQLKRELERNGISGIISTWRDLSRDFISLHNAKKGGFGVIMAIIVIISAVGIVNTMFMSTFERTREIGMMMALGFKDRDVKRLFLLEGAILGGSGSLLGSLLGSILTYAGEIYGINLTALYGEMELGYPVKDILYLDLTTATVI
ncbi:MAG: ABC transporter permease, partial [Fidelibacterota bacterium]